MEGNNKDRTGIMRRVNTVFLWGFFIICLFAAGARGAHTDLGDRYEALCAVAVIVGFPVYGIIALGFGVARVIGFWRARRRSVAVTQPVQPAARLLLPEPPTYWRDCE